MSNDINLIIANQKKPHIKKLILVKKIAISVAVITGVLSIFIFLATIKFSVNNVKNQQSDALSQLSPYHDKIAKILLLSDRATAANKILNSRPDYAIIVSLILSKEPIDVSVDTLSFDGTEIQISFLSNSLSSLSTFLNDVVSLSTTKNGINSIILTNLKEDGVGSYSMSLTIN